MDIKNDTQLLVPVQQSYFEYFQWYKNIVCTDKIRPSDYKQEPKFRNFSTVAGRRNRLISLFSFRLRDIEIPAAQIFLGSRGAKSSILLSKILLLFVLRVFPNISDG
uniref:Uncharacterized protein n=1 Tax=Glossina brevipalpis TaxID=37001 RepID=A0A1A9X533_9MUSC